VAWAIDQCLTPALSDIDASSHPVTARLEERPRLGRQRECSLVTGHPSTGNRRMANRDGANGSDRRPPRRTLDRRSTGLGDDHCSRSPPDSKASWTWHEVRPSTHVHSSSEGLTLLWVAPASGRRRSERVVATRPKSGFTGFCYVEHMSTPTARSSHPHLSGIRLAAAKAWWTDYLGFPPYFDEPFYVGFEVAGYELGLVPTTKPARAHDLLGRRRRGPSRRRR